MEVVNLYKANAAEITDVLCEAFYDYPVMKYVLGEKDDYDNRLHNLVGFFVANRALRKEPMFGIYNSEKKLVAAAIVTLPEVIPQPEELIKIRENLWTKLGSDEQKRYEAYGKAASGLLPKDPHHHLNMIGVRPAYKGQGFARKLNTAVEQLMFSHQTSSGLSLNT
ncbi:MAG: GNAT family N-acetyltransferase, partial [Ignavibacteriaceae bacterium]|nr:GNAT family N-acetyltransferase [Ignavibacteriaceae bacterium]